jgi:hypothetical protein
MIRETVAFESDIVNSRSSNVCIQDLQNQCPAKTPTVAVNAGKEVAAPKHLAYSRTVDMGKIEFKVLRESVVAIIVQVDEVVCTPIRIEYETPMPNPPKGRQTPIAHELRIHQLANGKRIQYWEATSTKSQSESTCSHDR